MLYYLNNLYPYFYNRVEILEPKIKLKYRNYLTKVISVKFE